ncbi:MAG TPA: hypothetical protein VEC16_03335 [Alphaproteobacteria bacterium]|nr:hypothetical protein [Alphaproteobacteria bacterium]
MPLSEEYLKSVSETQLKDRAYTPYELEKHERASMEEIRKSLKKGKYKKKEDIQSSLEFMQKLANKINIAIVNEKKDNKTTWELEADLVELKKVFDELEKMLLAIETQEVDQEPKPRLKRK